MTEAHFRYSLTMLFDSYADAQIQINSKVEKLRNLSNTLGIPFETLLADEFNKLWNEGVVKVG